MNSNNVRPNPPFFGLRRRPCAFVIFLLGALMALASAGSSSASTNAAPTSIQIGEKFTLQSTGLNEKRPYWVYLPASYHDKEFAPLTYPVLYLLDGDLHFQSASGVVQFMSENVNGNVQIPELIIVAIPNTARTRDLTPTHSTKGYDGKDRAVLSATGGGPQFAKFLKDELVPHIERTYRTAPFRILVCHSFGGLFTINSLLQSPPLFQAHIAIDPTAWWDDRFLLRTAKQAIRDHPFPRGLLYFALANDPPNDIFPDPLLWKRTCRELADFFETNNNSSFHSRFQYFENETHISVPLLALYHGLLFIFDGFKPIANAEHGDDPALLEQQFAKVSDRLGYKVKPSERFINSAAWSLLGFDKNSATAIKWLDFNKALYPESSNVYASRAQAHMWRGENEAAIKLYQRALEIWPENIEAKDALRKLTEK